MGSETESHSAIDDLRATSPTIHAVQTVTVAVDDAQLARSVAIQWHRTREGMQKTAGTPSPDGAEGATTITYNFVADRPGTFTYHARYRRDRATGIVNVRAWEAGPSAAGRARVDPGPGGRARTAAGHGVVNVPLSDQRPTAGSRAGTTVRRAIGCACGARGMASVEAQLMYNCPVIYYDAAEYDGGPPVQQLLRWSVKRVAAAVVNVRACEAGPSAGRPASTTVRQAAHRPASRGRVNVEPQVNDAAEAEYDGGPPVQRFLRWSVSTLAAAVLWVCGARDQDELRRGSQLSTTLS